MEKELGFAEVAEAKRRCHGVIDRIERLSPSTNITLSSKRTLLRLVRSELSFLSSPSSSSSISVNVGHLEAVVHVLEHPSIAGVSRVCKPILPPVNAFSGAASRPDVGGAHVDIACTLNREPVWFVVSDRNPKHVCWDDSATNDRCKGLRSRIRQVLAVARASLALQPSSLMLFFSKGLDGSICDKLRGEFGASEVELGFLGLDCEFVDGFDGDWVNVRARSYDSGIVFEIKVHCVEHNTAVLEEVASVAECFSDEKMAVEFSGDSDATFAYLIRGMKTLPSHVKDLSGEGEGEVINFDTTALIALVSGISNGGTGQLLAAPESALRQRFKGNYEFVIEQVKSEIENPIHVELREIICGRRGIVSETAHAEFKELVSMCGGPNEKLRADQLLRHLVVVPNCPSQRIMCLPTTRKLALKNKVVFGTGDHWRAPTLTANMAFVRAVSQTGLSLFTMEHRPRALTGD